LAAPQITQAGTAADEDAAGLAASNAGLAERNAAAQERSASTEEVVAQLRDETSERVRFDLSLLPPFCSSCLFHSPRLFYSASWSCCS
jgi:hypothetical protein